MYISEVLQGSFSYTDVANRELHHAHVDMVTFRVLCGVLPRDQLSRNQLPLNQLPIDQLPTGSTPIESTSHEINCKSLHDYMYKWAGTPPLEIMAYVEGTFFLLYNGS